MLAGALRHARGALFCALAGLAVPLAARAAELPAWQQLVFEQSRFGVTARSLVAVDTAADGSAAWQLEARSSVADNSETVTLAMAADSGALCQRARYSAGRNQRYKGWDYLPGYVERERREPAGGDTADPASWPVSSRKSIAYPAELGSLALTDAYALLPLAARLRVDGVSSAVYAVHTDFNFYRVSLVASAGEALAVDYRELPAGQLRQGERSTRVVDVRVSPLGPLHGAPDFSLLGLEGDIRIIFDAASDLPLQLRGLAPRVGATAINLSEVTLRTPAQ
ncbi:hypothetical protein [Haliea sp. E17]|uniref:hypothetical protein n=1 Tax=Haliea sp. E17 TaxID=3401576 RepID=UPI003AAE119A